MTIERTQADRTVESVTPKQAPAPKSAESSGRLPAVRPVNDTADISAAGHAALDAEIAKGSAATLTDGQAQQLGARLDQSNPAKFRHADANGDGRLSAKEAKAAGLD